MLIGAHVRQEDPLEAAAASGASCIQIFCGDPQSWQAPKPREDAEALKASGLPIYVHAPYIVNLASPDNKVRIPSRKILQQACDAATQVGALAVSVHGGHVRDDADVEEGFVRWGKGLASLDTDMPIYLENTAGGDHAMARRFDVLARLWDVIGGDPRLGFCLDTCHTHAAGEELVSAVDRILAITGRVDLVHCNGSRDAAGTGRDRHQNFAAAGTDNQIAAEALVEVVRTAGAPVICETPADGVAADIALLRDAVD